MIEKCLRVFQAPSHFSFGLLSKSCTGWFTPEGNDKNSLIGWVNLNMFVGLKSQSTVLLGLRCEGMGSHLRAEGRFILFHLGQLQMGVRFINL